LGLWVELYFDIVEPERLVGRVGHVGKGNVLQKGVVVLDEVRFNFQVIFLGILLIEFAHFVALEGESREGLTVKVINCAVDVGHQNVVQILLSVGSHILKVFEDVSGSLVEEEGLSLVVDFVFIVKVVSTEIDELSIFVTIVFGITFVIDVIQVSAFPNSFRSQHKIPYRESRSN